MNTFFSIVKMCPEHIAAVADLERICFSEPWSENSLSEEINNPDAYFICAVDDTGTVLGYAGMHTPSGDCYVDNIAVFPKFRKLGVGEALTKALADEALKIGEFISLEVRESNVPAIALYEKLGFTVAGRRRNFYSSPREDALIYTLHK